jgi:hypothetical protein
MQIFSELQRNSSDKIFIRLLLVYFVNFLGSYSLFFPIMLGLFLLCEDFFISLLFIVLFSFFHNFNLLFFVFVFLLNKFFLLDRLKDIVDFHYQDAVALFGVYFFLGVYLINFANTDSFLLIVYLIYNYAFDLIAIRLLKCGLKSY